MDMATFKKGPWKEGLFECKQPLCIITYFCGSCALAQIHEKLGNPKCGKPIACILAECGASPIQTVWYGQIQKGDKGEPIPCGILKMWCCGSCYIHQQYKEVDAINDPAKMITK